jgi:hypothetical protein
MFLKAPYKVSYKAALTKLTIPDAIRTCPRVRCVVTDGCL